MEGFTTEFAWFKSGAAEAVVTKHATASENRMVLILSVSRCLVQDAQRLPKSWSRQESLSFFPFAFGSPEHAMTLSGKLGDVILHFNEAHFDQGLEIVRTDGRQIRPPGFDITQYPAKMDRPL
jgi:hypothetical protein